MLVNRNNENSVNAFFLAEEQGLASFALDTPKNHLVTFAFVDLVTGYIYALKALIAELFTITFGSLLSRLLSLLPLALGFLLLVLFFKLCLI